MDFLYLILAAVSLLIVMDLLFGFVGLALLHFTDCYSLGFRLLSYSEFLSKYLPNYCRMLCSSKTCGNWTCPYYHTTFEK